MYRITLFIALLISTCFQTVMATSGPLPANRIVGYYGNFYSKRMGVLGEYPPEQVLKMLKKEVDKWNAADPATPVIPAIEYIAIVAQKDPGKDGKHRTLMPDDQIRKAIDMATKINGIAILDVQTGHSSVQAEVPRLASYLALPNVTLALDPEYSMPPNKAPGTVIGSMPARDINYAVNYLADIVRKHNLPPKVLIVHSFTENMITSDKSVKPVPEVQVVINMDGFGPQSLKMDSYRSFVANNAVQFTGIKLFYKQDLQKPSTGLFTPAQILKFKPIPMFILYQ